jgi:phenylacetate-CoA ligase
VDVARFPVTQPIGQIAAGLNAYQPTALMGYPSMLALLAVEARAGRLRILPRRVITTSEPLLPEVRRALTGAFCAPVANMYGTSEAGPIGVGCFRGPGIHLCDDLVIVEPVDLAGRPVPPGVRSDKIYVTAISNPTLPLIRFELTDQVTFLDRPCPCGSAHQLIADVQGRLDDVFVYPGARSSTRTCSAPCSAATQASSRSRSARPPPGPRSWSSAPRPVASLASSG